MSLDRKVKILLDSSKVNRGVALFSLDVKDARKMAEKNFNNNCYPSKCSFKDYYIQSNDRVIKVRSYSPQAMSTESPCLVYYHGGGGVIYSIETYDSVCRQICDTTHMVVVSVNYSLAPEYKYPIQIEDSYNAYVWVHNNSKELNVNSEQIGVMGDSFGGYLATIVCMMSRDRGYAIPIYQILLYPRTDFINDSYESFNMYKKGYGLDYELMYWFWNNYVDDFDRGDPYLCPIRSDNLSLMPRSLIITAENDPLRDEGESYARKLKQYGVDVDIIRVNGYIHGFILLWKYLDKSRKIIHYISNWVNDSIDNFIFNDNS